MKAIDFSRFSTGDKAVTMFPTDCELIIPGAWHGAVGYTGVSETLREARLRGKKTATYTALNQHNTGTFAVDTAFELVGPTNWAALSFVALDMETDGLTMQHLLDARDRVLALGQRPALYTAYWWWVGHFGNPPIPTGLPLWNAYYDNDPDYDFHRLPYGGPGVQLIGEQYTNTTPMPGAGYSVDYNGFTDAWVNAGPGAENGLLLLRKAWEEDMADTVKGAAALHQGPIFPEALGLFGLRNVEKAQNWAKLIAGGKK